MDKIGKLKTKMADLLKAAKAIVDKADAEERGLTEDERTQVKSQRADVEKLRGELKQAEDDAALAKQIRDLVGEGDLEPVDPGAPGGRKRAQTVGERFVTSKEFTGWMKQVAPSGRLPESARGLISPPVEVKTIPGLFGRKALVTGESDTSAGAFVETDYTRIYEPIGRDALTLRQLISVRQTTSDLVSFVRQTAKVMQAVPVAEANVTDFAGSTGEISGEKPEGTSAWEEVTAAVQAIAVWIPATKRAIADVPQLRGLVDQELRDDLAEELENQLINGTGVGPNLLGVLSTPGILTQAWNTDILTTCRQAITTLMVTGFTVPTAWLLNPTDWETIDLEKDTTGQFYFGGPLRQGTRTLWGYPVVQSVHVTQGQGILANWRKAVLWDRERATIQISDSHEDFFIRNMVAILAEMRATFGLISPDSFIVLDLAAGS